MADIDDNAKLKRNQEIIDSKIDDEIVMMDIDNGNYYGLNNIGSSIWEILDEPLSINELISKLTAKYDVSAEDCKKDIMPFVESMTKNKVLLLDE